MLARDFRTPFSPERDLIKAALLSGLLLLLLSLPAHSGEFDEEPPPAAAVPDALHPIVEPLRGGDGQKALDEARALADEWAGDPDFQFLYGLAAMEAGEYSEAILALDAVLIARPDDHRARLELARAQYQTGNWRSARREFRRVLDTDPPEQVRKNIRRFLDRMDERSQLTEPDFRLEGRYSLGHDTNINSATSADSIELDLFDQPFELALRDSNRETHDAFQGYGLNALYSHPLDQRRGFSVQAAADQTDQFSQDAYDLTRLRLGSSWYQRLGEDQQLQVTASGDQINLDNDRLRWQTGLKGELQQRLTASEQLFASLGVSAKRYPDQHERDTDQAVLGIGNSHRSDQWQDRVSLLAGVENARDSDNKHFGRRFAGFSASMGWTIMPRHTLKASGIYRFSRYDRHHPLFGERRRDQETAISAGWQWSLMRRLRLETKVTYQLAESSIEFYDFDRTQAQVGIRYQFFQE